MPHVLNGAFFDAVRPLFGGSLRQSQVDGLVAIQEAWERSGDGDVNKFAYLLATAFHETAQTMEPIHERGSKSYFNKYEPGTPIGKTLGNTVKGDGYKFRGRGYVQLTGRANYRNAGTKMGVSLIGDPEKALEPHIAGMALVRGCLEGWFTGKKLGDYINDTKRDFINARRVINGTDKASHISMLAESFLRALQASPVAPGPEVPADRSSAASQGWLAAIIAFILNLFKGLRK